MKTVSYGNIETILDFYDEEYFPIELNSFKRNSSFLGKKGGGEREGGK